MCTCEGECVDVLVVNMKIGGKMFTGENNNFIRVKNPIQSVQKCLTVQSANVMHGDGSRSSSLC